MEKILLPIDGSETCYASYDYARNLAEKLDAEVHILHVQSHKFQYERGNMMHDVNRLLRTKDYDTGDKPGNRNEDSEEITQLIFEHAKEHFDEYGVPIKTVALQGKPANEIMDYAEKEDVDLIVMCTHGMSGLKRYTMGSVTNKVVHHAEKPVLVVR